MSAGIENERIYLYYVLGRRILDEKPGGGIQGEATRLLDFCLPQWAKEYNYYYCSSPMSIMFAILINVQHELQR